MLPCIMLSNAVRSRDEVTSNIELFCHMNRPEKAIKLTYKVSRGRQRATKTSTKNSSKNFIFSLKYCFKYLEFSFIFRILYPCRIACTFFDILKIKRVCSCIIHWLITSSIIYLFAGSVRTLPANINLSTKVRVRWVRADVSSGNDILDYLTIQL